MTKKKSTTRPAIRPPVQSAQKLSATGQYIAIALAVAVMGLVAANLDTLLGRGPQRAAQSFVASTLEPALEKFRADTGSYPSNAEGLKALVAKPLISKDWNGPYLASAAQLKDPWSQSYRYDFPGNHHGANKPDVWSNGPDRTNGSADDVGNW